MTYIDKKTTEFEERFGKDYVIESEPESYIHKGLNSAEFLSHATSWIKEALTTQRLEILKEVEESAKKKRYVHSDEAPVIDYDDLLEIITNLKSHGEEETHTL